VKICKKCIQPDTRPDIFFNDEGVCGACLWEDEKKKIDWNEREKELQKIADWAKHNAKGKYDCAIGVSGGKDSTLQALIARDRLGLDCLLVNAEPENITEIGKHNIENLKNLGFDVISIRVNPKVIKKLMKKDFFDYLNPVKITEYPLWSVAYVVAEKFDIPLVIQGENAALTLGISKSGLGTSGDALNANKTSSLAGGLGEYTKIDGIEERDLVFFNYKKEEFEKKGFRAIWLQYYLKEWTNASNAEFAKNHGIKFRSPGFEEAIGTYVPYSQLDSDLVQVNQMLKAVKLGFGQCMDHACYDLRENRISREQAIEYVKKYDGKVSEKFIQEFCDYIEITIDEFWENVEKFRGTMWKKQSDGEWYNTYWDILDNN
jgi:N-acetyl sugar amidotransferase